MTLSASCHCGATQITVKRAPTSATACNCSYCAKSGALWSYYQPDEVQVVKADADKIYTATGFNLHHFCAQCGTNFYTDAPNWSAAAASTAGEARAVPEERMIALNVRLLDDFDIASLAIQTIDGRHLW